MKAKKIKKLKARLNACILEDLREYVTNKGRAWVRTGIATIGKKKKTYRVTLMVYLKKDGSPGKEKWIITRLDNCYRPPLDEYLYPCLMSAYA